jgi:hypothetical protein
LSPAVHPGQAQSNSTQQINHHWRGETGAEQQKLTLAIELGLNPVVAEEAELVPAAAQPPQAYALK